MRRYGRLNGFFFGDVEQAADAEGRVDGKAPERFGGLADLELQQIVQEIDRFCQVPQRIAHPVTNRLRYNALIAHRDRADERLVDRLDRPIGFDVYRLQRVARRRVAARRHDDFVRYPRCRGRLFTAGWFGRDRFGLWGDPDRRHDLWRQNITRIGLRRRLGQGFGCRAGGNGRGAGQQKERSNGRSARRAGGPASTKFACVGVIYWTPNRGIIPDP